jgi:hypothetical protein
MDRSFDIVSVLLGLMWASLAAATLGYAMRPILAGRNAVPLVVGIAALAFASGYLAHRVPPSSVATIPAARTLDARALSRLRIENAPALGSIDRVAISPGERTLDLAGWGADPRYRPGAAVFVLVDGTDRVPGTAMSYGIDRPDVARALDDAGLLWVGFGIRYVPSGLGSGHHFVQVAVVSSDLGAAYLLARRVEFTLP